VAVSKQLSKDKLHLIGMQDVRWEGVDTEPEREYTFFYGKGNENCELCRGLCA
jgi:hypothetical protein